MSLATGLLQAAAALLLACAAHCKDLDIRTSCIKTLGFASCNTALPRSFSARSCAHVGSSSSFIPEGYSYVGQHSVAPSSFQSKQYGTHKQKLSTGYIAEMTMADLRHRPKAQQQRSADKEHDTLLVTREGHAYTKR